MTSVNILLMLISALVTLVGVMAAMLYRDITRRLSRLEKQTAACLVILTLLLARIPDVPADMVKTIQTAIADAA